MLRSFRVPMPALAALVVLLLSPGFTATQALPTLRPDETTRWESLVVSSSRLGLSPDGGVLAYRIDRSDWDDELRITRRADGKTLVVPFGREPEYSADGRWVRFLIGHSEAERARLERNRQEVRDGLGLLNLETWTDTRVPDVERAAFDADGSHLAIEHYVTRAAAGGRGGARRGAETLALTVRTLATGASTAFENVQSFSWQPRGGHRLAMAMGGDSVGAARLQMFDAAGGGAAAVTVIDSSPASYTRVTWRDDGSDLAYLRSHTRPEVRGMSYDAVVVRGAGTGRTALTVYDATRDAQFPTGARLTDYRPLSWAHDGRTLFVGITDEPESAAPDDEDRSVRIWHWTDVVVMPRQVENQAKDRRRSRLCAIDITEARLTPLAPTLDARATPLPGTTLALLADWSSSTMARTLGRPTADLALVDIRTGARTPVARSIDEATVHIRPDGGAFVFLRDDHLWAMDTATRRLADLSTASGAAFIDVASDSTAPHKPLFGIGGWSADGAVLVYDRFDIWRVPVSGDGAARLTDGAPRQLRHRVADLDDADDDGLVVDFAQPVHLELFGERTKQHGYARLAPGGAIEPVLLEDRRIDSLTRSANGRVYAFVRQRFDQSPNIFVGTAALTDARAVTATNPQQSRYAWGTSAVITYTTPRGDTLDAALYYPAGYVAGRRYPTIVKVYERLSDEVHDYVPPSDMDEENITVFTQLGYAVLAPDIRYRPRDPGVSAADCVTAAVARAVGLGVTDAARVGIIGHSWGAYESAFLATHTHGVFAAAVAGAAITDLISQAGDHHWSTGVAETDHIETGQQRMQVPFYEDVDAYVRNSPIFGVASMTTPLLLEAGDQDGDVFWHQSVELYNAARRAGTPVVLLQYPDEDHALDDFDHRRDYQRRILQWFGHFLKRETAPPWITTGTPFIKR